MKFKKIFIIIFVVLFVFFTYYFLKDERINYVSLGDSIAAGQNPYGEKEGYGYTDYIKNCLEDHYLLKSYYDFAVSGYKSSDIINDINNFKKIDGKNIKEILRESDLVTISIGANDFIDNMKLDDVDFNNVDYYIKRVDQVIINLDNLFKVIREYAKNKIVVIGYYNPLPFLYEQYDKNIDLLFLTTDNKYMNLCRKYNIDYMSVYDLFKKNSSFLPNPLDIHPNINGYKAIGNMFIKKYLE